MKLVSTLLLLAAACSTSFAQDQRSDQAIEWNEYYKLSWTDFGGTPTADAAGDAGSVVQIKAMPFMVGKHVEYDIMTLFNRAKSWKRDSSSTELLAHEQLHFDLAELYARKIRQKVSELQRENVKDVGIYNREIQKILKESSAADMQYDLETLHGALDKKQEAWSTSIKSELAALSKFKKTKRVIRQS